MLKAVTTTSSDENVVRPNQMKCGDVGVIVKWRVNRDRHIGNVVQRYKDALVVLGAPSGRSFPTICNTLRADQDFLVKLIRPKEILINSIK